eukprot:m.102266 g.102266  ORF g.102266 m.102266 type:complete len:296 (-) comp20797_c0_seq1:168-1055(-)
MEPNTMAVDEANSEPSGQNCSPAPEETPPGRLLGLSKSLLASHPELSRSLESGSGRILGQIVWESKAPREGSSGQTAAAGGDGLSDSSAATEDSSSPEDSPSSSKSDDEEPEAAGSGSGSGPAGHRPSLHARVPTQSAHVDVDVYKTEDQIVGRMKELRKRYSDSLQHVRRLRRSLGSRSSTPEELDRRPGSGSWEEETQDVSRGSDEVESVFDEPVSRPRVKSLKRPEVVAQEKGIATASLFSTKPSTDEIKIDENGYKSYQCLLCSRTFTHPPAFSQHKRAHGREAAVNARVP